MSAIASSSLQDAEGELESPYMRPGLGARCGAGLLRSSSYSPAPSSAQRTGIVYTDDKQKYTASVPEVNTHLPETLAGELDMLHNNPDIDDEMREEFRRGIEGEVVGLDLRQRIIEWTDKTQKKKR